MKKFLLILLPVLVFGLMVNVRFAAALTWGRVVNCQYLSLRDGPGKHYRKLAEMPDGMSVQIYEDTNSYGFVRVFCPDLQMQGWASARYLSW